MIFDGKRQEHPEVHKLRTKSRKFRDLRLSTKLIIAYLFLTVIPMSLLGFISYRQYTHSIEEQNGEYLPKLLQYAGANIDNYMNELAALPEQLSSSDTVMSILRRESYQSQADLNKDRFTVNSYLARTYLEGGNPDVLGVFILSKNRLFQSTRLPYSDFDWEKMQIPYGQDLDLRGQAKVVLPGDIGLAFENNEPYLLILKQLNDMDNQKTLGTMFVAVRLSFISIASCSIWSGPAGPYYGFRRRLGRSSMTRIAAGSAQPIRR
ncbi:cache domain-containing protein [Paenibacillus chartarius]|uniref:Cache domain-containing protein n=1 Tax=Paenibacillus chartarius TaxID=747481 RepID=A0ABV6DUF0_9BACL